MKLHRIKFLAVILILVLLLTPTFSISNTSFIGESQGKSGSVKINIILNSELDSFKDITLESFSDAGFAKRSVLYLKDEMIKRNDYKLDAISGATISTSAFIKAVKDAVESNNIKLKKNNYTTSQYKNSKEEIVVVGGGVAGLTAAISASEAGKSVVLLEKMPFLGGNSVYATGGINLCNTPLQEKNNIKDSIDLYYNDTLTGGHNINNKDLVHTLANMSLNNYNWLTDNISCELEDLGMLAGASVKRAHRPKGGYAIGDYLFSKLYEKASTLPIDIRIENKLDSVKTLNNGFDLTIKSNDYSYNITCDKLILATGGFGANNSLIKELNPDLKDYSTTNHPGATGDAISWAKENNWGLRDLKEIQIHPTVTISSGTMITEAVRGNGAILVNKEAQRFVDELNTRDVVSKAIIAQSEQKAYLIFDQNIYDSLGAIINYDKSGLLVSGDTLVDLAHSLKINPIELSSQLDIYNRSVKFDWDPYFKRKNLPAEISKAPFYGVCISPAIHHTMGGLIIDSSGHVLTLEGKIVKNLYACGEVTGGLHGGNRLGGNAMADGVCFGRIAGNTAATE